MAKEKNILENAVVEETKIIDVPEVKDEDVRPSINSPEWHDYVMKQFQPDELVEGNPTTEGLRRVASLLLGEIIQSRAHCVMAPCHENNYAATIEHTVVIDWRVDDDCGGDQRTFTEIADVNAFNCDTVFRQFASATASTRAEGRALRKALKLKHVIAAEETAGDAQSSDSDFIAINPQQINAINHLCKKNNIDVLKFINSRGNQYNNIDEISYTSAIKMIGVLNEYTNDKSKIVDSVKGYKQDWRK